MCGRGPRAMASQPPRRSLATADGNRAPSSKNEEKENGDGMRRRTGANTKDGKRKEGEGGNGESSIEAHLGTEARLSLPDTPTGGF